MRSAECGARNDLTTLRFAHKERMISAERGTRSAERPCLNAERGVRNAERPHYTTFRSQGKLYECRMQNGVRSTQLNLH